jgi:hypothetical protein
LKCFPVGATFPNRDSAKVFSLPRLRFLRREHGSQLHFWPFDGWQPPQGRSVVAEIYPALWKRDFLKEDRNDHQHDAYCAARWMRKADADGLLGTHFEPPLAPAQRIIARTEGWILGLG